MNKKKTIFLRTCFPLTSVVIDVLVGFLFHLQETDLEKVVEVKKPRRGRSSRTSEEAETDQPQEPEIMEETPTPGLSGAAATEAAAGEIVA